MRRRYKMRWRYIEKRRSYIEVVVWDLSAFVLLLKMVQLRLESIWLVEDADDDIQTGHHTEDVGDEFWGVRIVNFDSLEERLGSRLLGKDSKRNSRSGRKCSQPSWSLLICLITCRNTAVVLINLIFKKLFVYRGAVDKWLATTVYLQSQWLCMQLNRL